MHAARENVEAERGLLEQEDRSPFRMSGKAEKSSGPLAIVVKD